MDTNKKLIKNTLYLYSRMLFQLVVSLYTSRAILEMLGVMDYGIYNVICGFVSMFSILSGSLSTSTSRRLTFELGRKDYNMLNKIFVMSIHIHIFLGLIIICLLETIGLWYLNNEMIIPENKIVEANIIYQIAIVTFCVNLQVIPFIAIIIAYEKMKIFANIGILEIFIKLVVVLILPYIHYNKLISYSILLMLVALIILVVYIVSCKRIFSICRYNSFYDKYIFKELFSFAGWNFIGSTSTILRDQGCNLILNLFFGPIVNSARAIAMQVNSAVTGFINNFTTALMPQITKSYATLDFPYLLNCIYKGSKFSFFLLYILSTPILFRTEYILGLWLVNVPENAVGFVQLILVYSLTDTYSRNLINANNATGKIKYYQLFTGILNIMTLPLSYYCLLLTNNPYYTLYVPIIISLVNIFPRIVLNKKMIPVTVKGYFIQVVSPTMIVVLFSVVILNCINHLFENNLVGFIQISLVSILLNLLIMYYLGLSQAEKKLVNSFVIFKLKKVSDVISQNIKLR
ncbi:lipopolysaccharide biosynthesis protein [Phocaeicola sp.]